MEPREARGRGLLTWGAILAGVGLVLLVAASVAGPWTFGTGGVMPCPGCPGGVMPFVSPLWALLTFLGWILVLGGLIALGIWLVQRVWPSVGGLTAMVPEDPLRIAQLRYARGEISREEYERIREELTRASRQ